MVENKENAQLCVIKNSNNITTTRCCENMMIRLLNYYSFICTLLDYSIYVKLSIYLFSTNRVSSNNYSGDNSINKLQQKHSQQQLALTEEEPQPQQPLIAFKKTEFYHDTQQEEKTKIASKEEEENLSTGDLIKSKSSSSNTVIDLSQVSDKLKNVQIHNNDKEDDFDDDEIIEPCKEKENRLTMPTTKSSDDLLSVKYATKDTSIPRTK